MFTPPATRGLRLPRARQRPRDVGIARAVPGIDYRLPSTTGRAPLEADGPAPDAWPEPPSGTVSTYSSSLMTRSLLLARPCARAETFVPALTLAVGACLALRPVEVATPAQQVCVLRCRWSNQPSTTGERTDRLHEVDPVVGRVVVDRLDHLRDVVLRLLVRVGHDFAPHFDELPHHFMCLREALSMH